MTYAIPALQDRCDSVRIINVGGASNNNSNDAGDNGPGGNNRTGSDRTLIRFRAAQSSRSAFYHPVFGPGVRRRPGYGPLMLAVPKQKKQQQARQEEDHASVSAGRKRGRASEEALLPRWNFRPSALQYDDYGNGTMSVQQIKELYVQDCERALRQGVRIPSRRSRTSSSASPFRCLQWNIQAFSSPFEERNLHTITPGIIAAILEQDADVLVLNEIAWRDEKEWRHNSHNIHRREDFAVAMEAGEEEYISEPNRDEAAALLRDEDSTIIGMQSKILLEEALQARGYHFITMTQHGDTPTLIASRQPVLQQHELQLSENRSALCILIDLSGGGAPTSATASVSASARDEEHRDDTNSSHNNTNTNTNCNQNKNKSNNYCWIVGTHLDAFAADQRRQEISAILQQFEHKNTTTPSIPVVVMGDFNQQRPQDYTEHEWHTIAASASRRDVPLEDGVAQILHEQHFRCVYDDVVVGAEKNNKGKTNIVQCNWNPTTTNTTKTLPPSTHWSGTTIDYTYYYCGGGSGGGPAPGGHAGRPKQLLTPEGVYINPVGYSDHRMTVTDWTLQQHHRHHPTINSNNNNDSTGNRNTIDAIVHEDDEEENNDDTDTGDHPAKKTEKHDTKGSLFNGLPPNRHHAWHNIHILDQYQLPQREQYWHW